MLDWGIVRDPPPPTPQSLMLTMSMDVIHQANLFYQLNILYDVYCIVKKLMWQFYRKMIVTIQCYHWIRLDIIKCDKQSFNVLNAPIFSKKDNLALIP